METKQRLHNAVAASASCLVSPGKEIKHVLGYNCELTYQPNKTFFQVEEKKKKEEANEDREKAGGANGQRDSIISRERRKEQVSSFFFFMRDYNRRISAIFKDGTFGRESRED